jgi:hypothetical protein
VERISAKEKHINKEFDGLGNDFREKQKRLDSLQDECNRVNKAVQELNGELQTMTDRHEQIKSELTGKSNAMGDLSPLKRLQQVSPHPHTHPQPTRCTAQALHSMCIADIALAPVGLLACSVCVRSLPLCPCDRHCLS